MNVALEAKIGLVRERIKAILQKAFPSILIQECAGTAQVLKRICSERWTFVILDLNLRRHNGLSFIRQIKKCCPTVPMIVFSLFSEGRYAQRALRAGAFAYVSKDRSPSDLVEVARNVVRGAKAPNMSDGHILLSKRETQVLELLGDG